MKFCGDYLYHMFFTDVSVNSQPIFMKFCGDYREVSFGKYCIDKKTIRHVMQFRAEKLNFKLTSLMGLWRDVVITNLLHVK